MKNNYISALVIFSFISSFAFSQSWIELMNDPSVNFYTVQKAFNKYEAKYEKALKKESKREKNAASSTIGDEDEGKVPGYMQYKRWEWFVEPRVYPSGDRSVFAQGSKTMAEEILNNKKQGGGIGTYSQGNWINLGPLTAVPTGGGGAGRLNCVEVDPANPNIIWVGAPSGGIWKSTDGGLTWSTNTDHLATLGITDIAIDPTNSNIMYAATGDGEPANGGNVDTYSLGVIKSTDGGNTWNITGLSFLVTQNRAMNRIIINPVNPNIVFCGASDGVYRSLDAGASWVRTLSGSIKDMEFKPGNPNIVYAASMTGFFRSLNGGNTFSQISSGAPAGSGVSRVAIAVTPADSNYIYLVAGKSDYGFLGLYRSINGGNSFTTQSTTPNLLGWVSGGTDVGGQSWYTLSIAASPIDKNVVVVGGVNIWRSPNSGVSWALNAHWQGSGAPYVHADIHELDFLPGTGTYFAATDGGLSKTVSNGSSWTDLSNGIQVAEMYRLGCSVTNPTLVIQGWQDNGCSTWSAGTWKKVLGGDGMEAFIDWSNASIMYGESQNGNFKVSTNAGTSWTTITTGISAETGAWVTPWGQDPVNSQTIYAGKRNMWKSTNRGTTWATISNFTSGTINQFAVAPSDPNYIYAAAGSVLKKTTNGGTSWATITGSLSGNISYVAVDPNDPNKVWVSISGFNATSKVYKSLNGGTTWTNITMNLPNIPANCIVNDSLTGGKDGVYVGTDLGVYYTDTTLTQWIPYGNGLPNVIVDELEIHYGSGKLRAATYGRGLWETSLINTSLAPAANFKGDKMLGCPGVAVQFTDMSTNNPTSWNWSFPNGTPSASTSQNPLITYTVAGTYNDVKLVATNASGSDSTTRYSYIGISPGIQATTSPAGSLTVCATSQVINSSYGASYKWFPNGQTNNFLNATVSGTYSVAVTDMFGCKDTSAAVFLTILAPPATPTITVNGDTLTSSPALSYQWYLNGTAISGATLQTYVGTPGGSYYVVVTDANGCTKQSATVLSSIKENNLSGVNMILSPSPNNGTFSLDITLTEQRKLTAEVMDVTGRVIYARDLGKVSLNQREVFSLQLSKGLYFISLKSEEGRAVSKFVVE